MQEVAGDGLIEEAAVGSTLRPYLEEIISMSNLALACATECRDLLDPGRLSDALAYCVTQGVMPPFSPCVRGMPEYALCVELTKEALSDYGWWEKRLKLKAARQARSREMAQKEKAS